MKPRSPELHFVVPGAIDQATGGYRYAARIVAGLRALGWRVTVHELPGRFPDADRVALRAAADAVRKARPGAVMVIDGLALPAFAPVIDSCARKLDPVALIHHPLALETGISAAARAHFATLEPRLVRRIGRAIVTSPATALQVAAMGVRQVSTVEPGNDRPRPIAVPRRRRMRLLSVATLVPRKGHLVAIAALRGLRALPWSLTAVGSTTRDRAHARRVRAACAAAGLARRMRFAGEVDPAAVGAHYARADLFVLATEHEGYGMALAEAMAHGVPVVATRVGAVPQTVFAGAGVLVRPRDPLALRRALKAMLLPRRRKRAATRARLMSRRLRTWEQAAANFAAALLPPSSRASRGGGK